MRIVTWRTAGVAALALAAFAAGAQDARAQMLGLGIRMASVSGSDSPALEQNSSSRTRFTGGFVRLHLLGSFGLEASMDYQSTTNDAKTAKVRNTPLQVSALLLSPKKSFAPYLLGGLGWYKHRIEAIDNGVAVARVTTTDFGYHLGGGLQLKFGRHAAVFADYRYVWVDANGIDGFSQVIKSAASLTSVVGLVASVAGADNSADQSVKRGGSVWVGGLTVYF